MSQLSLGVRGSISLDIRKEFFKTMGPEWAQVVAGCLFKSTLPGSIASSKASPTMQKFSSSEIGLGVRAGGVRSLV